MKTTNLTKMSLMRMNLQIKIFIQRFEVREFFDNSFVSWRYINGQFSQSHIGKRKSLNT